MTSVRGKRTVEVQPIQRGFSSNSAYQDDSLTDLANAWNNVSAAKRVLHRAETRANDAALPLSSQATHERRKRRVRVAHSHQRVFSPPIGSDEQVLKAAGSPQEIENYREDRRLLMRKLHQRDNGHYDELSHHRGKAQSYRSPTADKLYPDVHVVEDTSRDILERGSTNLSLDNSTQVRILNDAPSQTFISRPREPTVEVSPGLKVNRDYIPAYDRLYGNYGRDFPASNYAGHGRLNYGADFDTHHIYLAPSSYERLRQKVELQKNGMHARRTASSDMLRKSHHRETDAVVYMQNGPNGFLGDEYISAPVRKVARAPPAPHYKGFSIPQTHYKLPDGRIVSEETLPRKHNKKTEQKHRSAQKGEKVDVKPLQPSKSQSDNNQNKPTRKVNRKNALSSSKKEKRIESKESVSAYAWREGQKVVRDALGPLKVNKEKLPHSPPTKDGNPSSVNSVSLGSVGEKRESQREMNHQEDGDQVDGGMSGPRRGMKNKDGNDEDETHVQDRLSSEAKNVLEDLHLDSDKESEEEEDGKDEVARTETRQPLSFIIDPGQRKPPLGKSKSNSENEQTAPASKVRHYDSREVRKYMMLQKNKRKKKQQEQEQKKKDAEMKKQKQLEELYKKQKDSAKVIPKDNIQATANAKQLDKTFSKEPGTRQVQAVAVEGRRPPPKTHTMRKLDVTSSDKENKAFWSTSSSDTSSRSSPQTDISGQAGDMAPGVGTHPANTEVRGGDIVLIPVTEEGAPISVVGVRKVPSPSEEMGTTKQRTETTSLPVQDNASKENPPVGGEPPGNEERLQALKATAAALQSRLDSEVKKFASDLSSLLPTVRQPVPESVKVPLHSELDGDQRLMNHQLNIPPSRHIERPLSPRQLTWHNELGVPHEERWAFTVTTPGTKPSVRFEDEGDNWKSPFQTKQQRILGSEEQNQVFTGVLPGVQSITQQAAFALERKKQDRAATLIQASYRGHQVRQQLKWAAPKSSARMDHQREQFLVGLEGTEEHLTLSEGALSDDSANAEVAEDYLPKFQSLRASPHQHVVEPTPSSAKPSKDTIPESISNILCTPSAFEPTNDGLSVIDIFTRRYQQAQRSLIASRTKPQESKAKTLAIDRQISPQPGMSSPHLYLRRPTTLEYSDDEFHSISSRTKSSAATPKSHSRSQDVSRTTEPPYTPDFTEASKSRLSEGKEMSSAISEGSRRSKEARNTSLPSGSLSPPSGKKLPVSPQSQSPSPATTASISAVLQYEDEALGSPKKLPGDPPSNSLALSVASDTVPKKVIANSPCSLPLSPTNEKPKLSKSPMSDPGHQEVRRSPLGSNVYSSSDEEVPRSVRSRKRRGRKSPSSKKSPLSPVGQTNFRPISSPVAPSASSTGPTEKPPLLPSMVGYSPSALQLKMASELNLLEMLDASSQQVAEMEHARTMALAHEESAALARILEVRQREHERELQLLSMKAKQEVEEANRQLEEVRQKVASTTLETEKILMKSKLDAAESRKEAADRLLQTQAEASRITAEAAKQLAEAHNAAASKPPTEPADPGRLASESVQAAVTAALEQQRLHQLEMLKEMRSGFKSPPPPRRSLGVGVNLPQRSPSHGPSRSPTPHYTEDFTHSASTAQSVSRQSTASQSKVSASKSSSSPGDSIKTSDELKSSQSKASPSVPESIQSDTSMAKTPERVSRYSLQSVESENDSSIHTDSGARKASNDTASIISEKLDDTKSVSDDYSISFEESASEVESVVDTSDRAVSQSKKSTDQSKSSQRPSSRQAVTTETRPETGRASNLPTSGMHDTTLVSPTPPYQMSVDYIKQQLEEEDLRSKQQMALLSLRERALTDKTQAELQWLEHQKKQVKDSRDTEGLEIVRRRQKDLVTKMNKEKEEIALLREAQVAASHKRRMLLQQQEGIIKLQQSTQRLKARTRNLAPISPHLTSFESHVSHDSPERPKVTSSGSSYTLRDDDFGVNDLGITREPNSTLELSPAEKQMKALQKVKLSARGLSKRAVNLKKRRKEAEELLAWKQKLDQEEEEVVRLEKQVKTILKVKPSKSQEKAVSPLPQHHKQSSPKVSSEKDEPPSSTSQMSERLDTVSSGMSEHSRTKSKSSISSKVKSKSAENSVPEELSVASSVTEEIETGKSETKSKKSPSRSPNRNSSSDETVKDASLLVDYANESFDSVDHTVTPVKSASPSPSRTTSSLKPSPVFSPLSPSKRKQESESGSESERSLSQTFSETASDQSDIEGRIRALTDSLKKRKIEADKLRKQQKRLYREKLKAQEASLKKQLETYDNFISQTRKDLVKEMDTHVPSVMSGAKPQIKHLSISETQRKRDQSHTRALRQRTASESSVEGSVEIPKKRGQGFAENKRSSRSSIEEDPVSSSRDMKQTQEDEPKKSSEHPSRSRSLSGDSSITEDLSLRSLEDPSLSETSPSVSHKSHDKIPEEKTEEHITEKEAITSQDQEKSPDSDIVPESQRSQGKEDGEETVEGVKEDTDADKSENLQEQQPESSEIPEEISSALSEASSRSVTSARKTLDFLPKDTSDNVDDGKSSDVSVKSSKEGKSPSVSSGITDQENKDEQLPVQSPRTESRSSSKQSQTPRTEPSYSEDFQESSVSIPIKESKSDTEDDISEHLSDRSTASGESQLSEKFVSRPQDEPVEVQVATLISENNNRITSDHSHQGEERILEPAAEVTVSPRITEGDLPEEEPARFSPEAVVDVPEKKDDLEADLLPNLPVGCRVIVEGDKHGTLKYKGRIKSRDSFWVGVELDEPVGNNDGSVDGIEYFSCAINYGLFVSLDKVKEEEEEEERNLSRASSVEEELPSQSSISAKVDSHDKSESSLKFTEEFPTGANTDDEESITEDISEGVTDDAALQKVIISTAEAVESFSFDRDEPEGGESSPHDTPRGPPEDTAPEIAKPKPEVVEKIATDLIEEVVVESVKIMVDVLERQQSYEEKTEETEEAEKPKPSSFLELITPSEGEGDSVTPLSPSVPSVDREQEASEKKEQAVKDQVEVVLRSVVQQTIDEMIKVMEAREEKWKSSEQKDKPSINEPCSPKTPEKGESLLDVVKISTPYTPDSDRTTPGDDDLDSPLPDELFINRVKVESAISGIRDGDDTTPRARPTSPIFGESGSINPQALSDKLEQLQALDQDIFGADLFGGQEWFDDDFGSMPKSNSIIKVPRRAADDSAIPSRSPSPEEPLPKYNEARHVELKKLVEEPFMAVPHNKKDVTTLMQKAVTVVHEKAEQGESLDSLTPMQSFLGSDTIGSDIESTSKKAYKHLLFDLAKETYQAVVNEHEAVIQPPWMKPKRRPRKFLFQEVPKSLEEMNAAVNSEAAKTLGLDPMNSGEAFNKYTIKKKRDKVDEILIQELREEEQEWVDYDDDELSVKMQLTESIFTSLLSETASVLMRIHESRVGRENQSTLSDSDIEF